MLWYNKFFDYNNNNNDDDGEKRRKNNVKKKNLFEATQKKSRVYDVVCNSSTL